VLVALGARPDVVSSVSEAAGGPRRDCLSSAALRVLLSASRSRVRNLPPTVAVVVVEAKWKERRASPPRAAAHPPRSPLTPRHASSLRPATT
jgi:hypothetical protein